MMTLFELVEKGENYDKALEWYARLRTEVTPVGEDAYVILQMCLTAFCFARAFYSDAYARRTQEYDDPRKRIARRPDGRSIKQVGHFGGTKHGRMSLLRRGLNRGMRTIRPSQAKAAGKRRNPPSAARKNATWTAWNLI